MLQNPTKAQLHGPSRHILVYILQIRHGGQAAGEQRSRRLFALVGQRADDFWDVAVESEGC